MYNDAVALTRTGDIDGAIEIYHTIMERTLEIPEVLINYGNLVVERDRPGDREMAVRLFHITLENADHPSVSVPSS